MVLFEIPKRIYIWLEFEIKYKFNFWVEKFDIQFYGLIRIFKSSHQQDSDFEDYRADCFFVQNKDVKIFGLRFQTSLTRGV